MKMLNSTLLLGIRQTKWVMMNKGFDVPKFMVQENEGKCVNGQWDKGIYC